MLIICHISGHMRLRKTDLYIEFERKKTFGLIKPPETVQNVQQGESLCKNVLSYF